MITPGGPLSGASRSGTLTGLTPTNPRTFLFKSNSKFSFRVGKPSLIRGCALFILCFVGRLTPLTYLNRSCPETERVRLCRRKATDCQRTVLTTIDPDLRLRYSQLANLWRELADEAERRTNEIYPFRSAWGCHFSGSWPCQNVLPQRPGMRRGCDASCFFRL